MINDRFRFARLFRRIPRLRADANAPAEAGDSTSDSAIPRFRGEKVMPDTSLRRLSAYSLAGLVTLALAAALLLLQPADPALAQDDAKGPKITSGPTIASSPASEDTYRAGETITVAVTFSKPVTITEHPRFRLQIGDTGRWAGYESASTDGATLSFAYVVKAADADPDGVSFKKNSLDLNGGTIKDADGNRARLHHDKVADQAGHRVDGSNSEPQFPADTTTRSVSEIWQPGDYVGDPVTAEDADDDTLTYALTGSDAFIVIAGTGQIFVAAGSDLDYETQAEYTVTLTVSDGKNAKGKADARVDDTIQVTITVTNVDEPGVISLSTDTPQVGSELTFDLTDPDGSVTLQYVLWFSAADASSSSGHWKLIDDWTLQDHQEGDNPTAFTPPDDLVGKYLRVFVAYSDGEGSSKNALGIMANQVLSRANRDPQFPADTTTRSLNENSGPGANVGAPVTATDPDDDTLTYALSGADASSFSIDAATGQITANSSLDYEEKHTYSVTVSADDDDGGSATVDVAITVSDRYEIIDFRQAEVPDTVKYPPDEHVALEYTMSHSGPHDTGSQSQSKPSDASEWNTYSIVYNSYLAEDPNTFGVVRKVDKNRSYDFRMRVTYTDGSASPWSQVTARANRPPAFASATATRSVNENAIAGPGANVGAPVAATDPDNDTLTYALSGADASAFSIDSAGQITANSSLDYEEKHSYSVTVSAEDDWGGSDTVDVAITVIDRHEITNLRQVALRQDELPEGGSITDYVAIEWDVSAGAHASNLQIWSETVRSGTQAPGPRRGFKIEKDTSAIRIVQSAPGGVAYDFRVRLAQKDGFNVSLYSPESTITVRANRPPAFASATTTRWAPEKTGPGANVGAPVTATDPDNDTLKYALSGADASAFSIDSAGQITANSSLDRGTRSSYSVTVSAADQWSGSGATEVTIKVGGSDDAIPTVSDLRQVEVLPGIVQAPHSPMNYVALEWTLPEGYDLSIHSMAIQRKGVCETNWSASLGAADYSLAVCKNGNCQSNPYGRTASLDWGSHSLAQAGLDVLALVAVPGPGTYDFRVSMARRDGTIRSDWAQVTTMPPAGATSGGPTPSITGPEGPVTGAFQIRVAFPESVTGLEPGDFVTNIAPYDLHNNEFPGVYGPASSGADHTFYVDPVRNGQLTIRLPVGAAQSGCGEHNLASETFTVQVNESNPTPKIYVYEPGPMVGPFNAYISFPEDVQLTALMGHPNGWREDKSGLDMRHIKVTNGIVTDLSRRVPNGPYSGIRRGSPFFRDYALAITPLGDGPVTIELLPGAAWGKESKSFDWNGVKVYDQRLSEAKQFSIEADLYRAKTTITGPESPLTVVGSFHITVTFSKPVVLPRGWELLDRRVLVVNRIKKGMATEGRGNIVWADAKKEGGGIRSIIYTVNPAVLGELTLDLREGVFQIAGNPTRHHDPAIREEMEKGNFPATFSVEIVRAGTQ